MTSLVITIQWKRFLYKCLLLKMSIKVKLDLTFVHFRDFNFENNILGKFGLRHVPMIGFSIEMQTAVNELFNFYKTCQLL